MSVETTLLALCQYQQTQVEALRPILVGPTGARKTTLSKSIADTMQLPFVRLLLSQQLPEDIGGWPQAKKDKLVFLLMEEIQQACDGPAFILLDEFDKVRSDVRGAVLTLTFEKAIRNKLLHPQTVIVAAMQPVTPSVFLADETGKAMSARMVFLPVNYEWGYIEKKYNLELPHLHEREKARKIVMPVMEATPRTVDHTLAFLRSGYGMKLDQDDKRMVLYGALAKQDAEIIEKTLTQSLAWVDPVDMHKVDPTATIDLLDVHTLTQHIGPLMSVLTPATWQQALEKVWLKGTEDDAKAFLQNAFDYIKGQCEQSPNKECEIFGTATTDEIMKATNDAAIAIAKVWEKQTKKKGK